MLIAETVATTLSPKARLYGEASNTDKGILQIVLATFSAKLPSQLAFCSLYKEFFCFIRTLYAVIGEPF